MANLKIAMHGGCALLFGNLGEVPMHAQTAAALCAGLDGPFFVRDSAGGAVWNECTLLLVPGGVSHALKIDGRRFAVLYMDPGGFVWRRLTQGYSATGLMREPPLKADWLSALRAIDAAPFCECQNLLEDVLFKFAAAAGGPFAREALDERLVCVMQQLVQAPHEAPGVETLAASIAMSPSWLHHAFQAQLGVPLRRYRTWFRLKAAVLLIRRGCSLADAAITAGFYDQSHFIHGFRESFGLTPGAIFGDPSGIEWCIENEELTERLLFA